MAELETAVALRAWQLAPHGDKQVSYQTYVRALEREAALAGQLRQTTPRRSTPAGRRSI